MAALSVFDISPFLSCSLSFHMEVVKSTDSIDWVSCSTITGVVSDDDLFCLFFSNYRGYIV